MIKVKDKEMTLEEIKQAGSLTISSFSAENWSRPNNLTTGRFVTFEGLDHEGNLVKEETDILRNNLWDKIVWFVKFKILRMYKPRFITSITVDDKFDQLVKEKQETQNLPTNAQGHGNL